MRNSGCIKKYKQTKYVLLSVFVIGFASLYVSMSQTFRQTYLKTLNRQENAKDGYLTENEKLQNITQQMKNETTKSIKSITVNTLTNLTKVFSRLYSSFNYPLNIDMTQLVDDVKKEGRVFYKPINVYNYKLMKNCEFKCKLESNTSKLLLFAIKSATWNIQRRIVIRETWGNETEIGGFIIKRVFVLGLSNAISESHISKEWRINNDLIQYNFNDHYFNNTLKTIGIFNWITSYCKQASFVLFVDDDYFVSPYNLVEYLKELPDTRIRKFYMGNTNQVRSPFRDPRNRWHVSRLEYPFSRYPPFINAGAYVMSISTVIDMQIAMQYTQLFKLDDVFLGIVAFKLKIELTGNQQFYVRKITTLKNIIRRILACHGFTNPNELRRIWYIYKGVVVKFSKKHRGYRS